MATRQESTSDRAITFPGELRPYEDYAATMFARNATDKRWDPRFHKHRYYTGDEAQLIADVTANNGLNFFIDLPTPPDRGASNCSLDGQTDIPRDLDGLGVTIGGDFVVQPEEPPIVGENLSFRKMLLAHSWVDFTIRGSIKIVDGVEAEMVMPGFGVQGGVSTTDTTTTLERTQHGEPHRANYYRFGGPDMRLIVQMERNEQWAGFWGFDSHVIKKLVAWFDGQEPAVSLPACGLSFGMTIHNWGWKPLV